MFEAVVLEGMGIGSAVINWWNKPSSLETNSRVCIELSVKVVSDRLEPCKSIS